MRTILITGGTSGLGFELAKLCYTKFNLVICSSSDRRISNAKKYFEEINNSTDNILIEKCDVSDRNQVNILYDKVIKKFNEINILINNAGIYSYNKILDSKENELDKLFDINFKGAYNTIKCTLPQMIEKQEGIIVNVSSTSVHNIFKGNSLYAASKAALEILSNTLREEVRNHNIKVINFIPGAIATEIWSEENLQKYSNKMIQPQDAAKVLYSSIIHSLENKVAIENININPINGSL